jgi:hypothetical protein
MPLASKEAQREYQRKWAAARRAKYAEGQECARCGSADSLEMHHVDPEQKVSHNIWSWAAARLEAELAKCEWLCAPCHREHHGAPLRKHGLVAYERRGCRCDVCKAAKAEKNRRYRAAQAARAAEQRAA